MSTLTLSSLNCTVQPDLYLNSATASLGTSNWNICQRRISTSSYVHAFITIHSIHRLLKPKYCCDQPGTLERDNIGLSALRVCRHTHTCMQWLSSGIHMPYEWESFTRILYRPWPHLVSSSLNLLYHLLFYTHCLLFVFLNLVKTSGVLHLVSSDTTFYKCSTVTILTTQSYIFYPENINILASYWCL